jgi:hypothetical protein
MRGQSITFTVEGAEGGVVTNWRYVTQNVGTITRANNLNAATWPGVIVDQGVAYADVTFPGQSTIPLVSPEIVVTARDFAIPAAAPTTAQNGFTCVDQPVILPVPITNPEVHGTLGRYCVENTFGVEPNQILQVADGGPNHAIRFISGLSGTSASFRWLINPDLDEAMSP